MRQKLLKIVRKCVVFLYISVFILFLLFEGFHAVDWGGGWTRPVDTSLPLAMPLTLLLPVSNVQGRTNWWALCTVYTTHCMGFHWPRKRVAQGAEVRPRRDTGPKASRGRGREGCPFPQRTSSGVMLVKNLEDPSMGGPKAPNSENTSTIREVMDSSTLNFNPNFKFSRLFFWGDPHLPWGVL